MEQVFTFHKTVRGHLHVMREIPCEDYSDSFSDENGKFHIAIVADGHGSASCFRSSTGSQFASEVAMKCLKEFAESVLLSPEMENRFYLDLFSNPRYRQMTIRRLTDTLLADWHDRVMDDYAQNPPTSEEMGEYSELYANGKNAAHIYGTTVIAALLLPKCLLLFHQGDGRCDVFYDDGTVDQPVPWDDRCEDTATTSLCDTDAAESFRHCIINLEKKNVIACYLGCDGVEDAYRDTYEGFGGSHCLMGGVHTFYKDLTCQLAAWHADTDQFENFLDTMLPEFSADGRFSRSGSGDDISVAGIVDLSAIQQQVEHFSLDVKKYSLEEHLFGKEDELRGKTRKHGILYKRMTEAEDIATLSKKELQDVVDELQNAELQHQQLNQRCSDVKKELEQYQKESSATKLNIDADSTDNSLKTYMKLMNWTVQEILDPLTLKISQIEQQYKKLLEQLADSNDAIQALRTLRDSLQMKVEQAKDTLAKATENFNEYDRRYKAIEAERQQIVAEIQQLDDGMK